MSSSASVTLVTNLELEKLFQNRSDLKKGDKLEGKILEVRDNGKAVIDFGNFQAEVDLKFPVEKGDVIHLEVIETGKQLKLKIEAVETKGSREITNLLKEADVQQEKSLEELAARIDQLLQKELKNLESGGSEKPQARALEDIGLELAKLKEHLQTQPTTEPIPREIRQQVEQLLKNVETTLQHLPESTSSASSQRLEALSTAIRDLRTAMESQRDLLDLREQVVKEVAALKTAVEELHVPDKKELEAVINKLSEAVAKTAELESPEQAQELRRMISQEIKPQLTALRQTLDQKLEIMVPDSDSYRQTAEMRQRVENLEKTIEITLQKSPPQENPVDINTLVKNVEKALAKVSFSESPPPDTPKAPEHADTPVEIRARIELEMSRLKEMLQPVARRETITPEVKPRVEELLDRVESRLQELPANYKNQSPERAEQLQSLFKEIHNLRTTIDAQRDFQELQDRVVKEIVRLKVLAEELDGPARKEVEAVINRLSKAAETVSRLEGPEQLSALRRLVSTEIAPDLKALDEMMKQRAETTVSGTPEHRQAQEISQRAEQLQRDIQVTLQRMPDSLPSLKQLEPLIQKIELALSRISEAPQGVETPPEVPQFSEDIQSIYENIKKALRLLQNNLRISGDQLEIPEQIRQVFLNLQSDLKAADATTHILEQMTLLKDKMIQADLPIEKVVKEIVDSLNEMMERIKVLKDQNNFTEIRELVQHRLGPQLKMMSELFGNEKLLSLLEGGDQVSSVNLRNAVREIQEGIQSAFVRGESSASSSELTRLMEITDKLAALPNGAKGEINAAKTSETIAQLSKNIEEFLARLPQTSSAQESGTSVMADKIKSLLSTLQTHFEPLDLGQDALSLIPRLKALVENSGLFFEKKLGDILDKLSETSARIQDIRNPDQLQEIRSIIEKDMKPNLLQLREQLADDRLLSQLGDGKSLENMRAAVQDLLSHIGTQQDRAVDSFNQQSQMQLFSFHVPIKDEEPAELKVFYNKSRKKDSPEEFKLSLLLDMSKLGEIRSDFFSLKDDLSITFYVGHDRVKDLFQEHLEEVSAVLEPVFKNLNLNIIVSREKAASFAPAEQEEQILSDKAVNLKI